MNTFAGFWIDGAVRNPEATHADVTNMVFVLWKDRKEFDLVNGQLFSKFEGVYWLDTTPRESLTPEELLSVVKVIMPSADKVNRSQINPNSFALDLHAFEYTPIDWGNLTQYPPPVEPQWIRITRENVGQYLFRECRFRDDGSQPWRTGKVSGWDEQDGCCLVNSDFEEEMPIMQWSIVEVQA